MTKTKKILTKITRKKITSCLSRNRRVDGRKLMEHRKIYTKTGLIEKASGSTFVSFGNTKVIVGVKVQTGEPYLDKPDEGVLTVNVELVPLASPSFEAGPPRENAIELARVVDRGLRESKAIDLKKLCIIPGKLVFIIFVDIYVLDHDGNLFDTSALASILALMNTKIREYSLSNDGLPKFKDNTINLPIQNFPIEITILKIGNKFIVDPTLEEEVMMETQVTIAIGKDNKICAIQKSGIGTFSLDEVYEAIDIARDKAKEIRVKVLGETK